jgi:hypothetical protein
MSFIRIAIYFETTPHIVAAHNMACLQCTMRLWLVFLFSLASYGAATGYVGSKACFACHGEVYRSFAKTGMGRSMRPAEQLTTADLPATAAIPVPSTKRVLEVFRDNSGWHQRESEPDVFQTDHRLDYAVGSGTNGLTFLVRRDNYLFQAPLSFYSKTGKWDLSPGYEQIDLGFSRMVPLDCIACHAGPMPIRHFKISQSGVKTATVPERRT